MTSTIVDLIKRTTTASKPSNWPLAWPLNNFIVRRTRRQNFVYEFVREGYKVILCCATNKALIKAMNSLDPWITKERHVSKGQHLIERLDEIGIKNFELTYYKNASPYLLGVLDERSTLQTLRSRLDAQGFQGYDHEELFAQEYTLYNAPTLDTTNDVLCFTNTKFISMLTARKRPWWDYLGMAVGLKWVNDPKDRYGLGGLPQVQVARGPEKMVVIFDDPPAYEFDTMRRVNPENVEYLRSSVIKTRSTRVRKEVSDLFPTRYRHKIVEVKNLPDPRPYLLQGSPLKILETTSKPHQIIEEDGEPKYVYRDGEPEDQGPIHYELRPEAMEFGRGLRRGYSGSQVPKLLVVTTKNQVAEDAYACLDKREAVERVQYKGRPIAERLMGLA